jgi:hypothetical protein
MKVAFKTITLGTFASLAMCLAFHPELSFAKSQPAQMRCFAHPKSETSQSRLVANQTFQQLNWTTHCTSAFSATVSGTTSLSARLERFENGRWITIDSGSSLSANVGPGTYRVLVINEWGMPSLYSFTYRMALG